MDLQLIRATPQDADDLLSVQKRCFQPLFERYRDERSPYNEPIERMLFKIGYGNVAYYKIIYQRALAGGIFVYETEGGLFRVGILYVLPECQSKGIGQKAIALAEALHGDAVRWELDCPEDLPANRRCYEKAGYRLTGRKEVINDHLTLVYYGKPRR